LRRDDTVSAGLDRGRAAGRDGREGAHLAGRTGFAFRSLRSGRSPFAPGASRARDAFRARGAFRPGRSDPAPSEGRFTAPAPGRDPERAAALLVAGVDG